MPRLLFRKAGDAVWISHLDLMRLMQRAFKRAGLPLTHTKGFNPRPSVSIALPLSVGVSSECELLDFDLDGEEISNEEILARLNPMLIAGVEVKAVYSDGKKLKELSFLDARLALFYDAGVPQDAAEKIRTLFTAPSLLVEKHSKNGLTEQDIIPMVKRLMVKKTDEETVTMYARICCQNPSLNPNQLVAAITRYLPDCAPSDAQVCRLELYNTNQEIFR